MIEIRQRAAAAPRVHHAVEDFVADDPISEADLIQANISEPAWVNFT
jgi:hypothetical protein